MADDFKVQISYKLGPNYADMLNVRADTAEELWVLLDALQQNLGGGDTSTIQAILETGNLLRAAGAAAPLVAGVPQQAASAGDIPPTSVPAGRSCAHGLMTHRTGTSAKGAWEGWFCPLPKGAPGRCKAQFK